MRFWANPTLEEKMWAPNSAGGENDFSIFGNGCFVEFAFEIGI